MSTELVSNFDENKMSLPEKVKRFLGRALPPTLAQKLRLPLPIDCIVEGTYYDEWNQIQVSPSRQFISPEVTRLHAFGCDEMILMGIWEEDSPKPVNIEVSKLGTKIDLEVDNPLLGGARIRSVVTRDGRIFHDISLLSEQPNFLISFLDEFAKSYSGINPATNIKDLPKLLSGNSN